MGPFGEGRRSKGSRIAERFVDAGFPLICHNSAVSVFTAARENNTLTNTSRVRSDRINIRCGRRVFRNGFEPNCISAGTDCTSIRCYDRNTAARAKTPFSQAIPLTSVFLLVDGYSFMSAMVIDFNFDVCCPGGIS